LTFLSDEKRDTEIKNVIRCSERKEWNKGYERKGIRIDIYIKGYFSG